jgi:hypothetical protein
MARGGRSGKKRTQYVRDAQGQFSSTPGGGKKATPSSVRKAAKSAAIKGKGSLAARTSLKSSKAKLAASPSAQQKGAVTRGKKKLNEVSKASRTKIQSSEQSKLRKKVSSGLMSLAKSKKKPAKKAEVNPPTKKVNVAAQRAKRMATRTGVVPGSKFETGKSVKTMSLKEMRSAVMKSVKGSGKVGMATIARAAGTGEGLSEIKKGRMPKTRSEWERAYRARIKTPMSDRNRKERPGVINGIDIHKNFRPWAVFGLDPKKASKADVEQAYRRIAKKVHPDVGGRPKDFDRVKKMRDSVIALMNAEPTMKGISKKGKPKTKAKTKTKTTKKSQSTRSGPLMLPPARS